MKRRDEGRGKKERKEIKRNLKGKRGSQVCICPCSQVISMQAACIGSSA